MLHHSSPSIQWPIAIESIRYAHVQFFYIKKYGRDILINLIFHWLGDVIV